MSKKQKILLKASVAFAICFAVTPAVNAMHIMEGYLPVKYCIAWGVICVPFLVSGIISIQKLIKEHRKLLLILAMAGAYAFVLSALKIPSVSGSSSHPTGTGLSAILFGPGITAVIGVIVLLFQAVLLAHGGLTTLGANTFSMAIAGPLVSFGIYHLGKRFKWNQNVTVFLAACLGDLFTYCVTSIQLAVAFPSEAGGVAGSAVKFLGVFAVTQVPLAIIEGLLTVVVVMGLSTYAKRELNEIGFMKGANAS